VRLPDCPPPLRFDWKRRRRWVGGREPAGVTRVRF